MLVVDLLHEFELGVWRAVFQHLIRILEAAGTGLTEELNRRSETLNLLVEILAHIWLGSERSQHLEVLLSAAFMIMFQR